MDNGIKEFFYFIQKKEYICFVFLQKRKVQDKKNKLFLRVFMLHPCDVGPTWKQKIAKVSVSSQFQKVKNEVATNFTRSIPLLTNLICQNQICFTKNKIDLLPRYPYIFPINKGVVSFEKGEQWKKKERLLCQIENSIFQIPIKFLPNQNKKETHYIKGKWRAEITFRSTISSPNNNQHPTAISRNNLKRQSYPSQRTSTWLIFNSWLVLS